jgi:hypothetical protein
VYLGALHLRRPPTHSCLPCWYLESSSQSQRLRRAVGISVQTSRTGQLRAYCSHRRRRRAVLRPPVRARSKSSAAVPRRHGRAGPQADAHAHCRGAWPGPPELLAPAVQALGRRHAAYSVTDAHHGIVGAALLWTLEHGLGDRWTRELRGAWAGMYGELAAMMQQAGTEPELAAVGQGRAAQVWNCRLTRSGA